jgi:hypothetical protein
VRWEDRFADAIVQIAGGGVLAPGIVHKVVAVVGVVVSIVVDVVAVAVAVDFAPQFVLDAGCVFASWAMHKVVIADVEACGIV